MSDDYALTASVRRAGMRILFVPACLVPSYERCGWGELWEFSTRQMKITRVYAPAIFRVALVSYAMFTGTLAALTLALGSGFLAPAFWVVLVGLAVRRGDYRLAAARRAISHPSIESRRWFYRVASPLVAFLFLANSVAALAGRTIEWKGIVYRMKSPAGTEIVRRVPPRGASGLIG